MLSVDVLKSIHVSKLPVGTEPQFVVSDGESRQGSGSSEGSALLDYAIKTFNDGKIPTLLEVERLLVSFALEQTGGNKQAAAKLVGISPRKMHYRIAEYEGRVPPPKHASTGRREVA